MAKRWTVEKRAALLAQIKPCETCGGLFLKWRSSDPGRFCSRRCGLIAVRPMAAAKRREQGMVARAAREAAS